MITQIEIDGFKTFKDFKVELAPFQVIIGPNGSGKSNLFDAFQLLSRLAEYDLLTAFQGLRGSADDQFTKYPDGGRAEKMRFAVEMLVDHHIEDDLGRKIELTFTRLRYEIEIALHRENNIPDQIFITYESLKALPQEIDVWDQNRKLGRSNSSSQAGINTTHTFFSFTQKDTEYGYLEMHYSDADINKEDTIQILDAADSFPLKALKRTILSGSTVTQLQHAVAVRKELRSFQFLHLNPAVLRQPSSASSPSFLTSEGGNLPTILARMQAEDKFALADVSLAIANLVPNLTEIELKRDEIRNEYSIWANYSDIASAPSYIMSDGTLCLLALATLANDPEFHGVLCLEEPENSVDTLYLQRMAHLLKQMATDFTIPEQLDEPLRQVLVTTHSPTFISLPDVIHSLLFAHAVTRVEPSSSGIPSSLITLMNPVETRIQHVTDSDSSIAMSGYTIDQIKKYLNSENIEDARHQVEEVRTSLNKIA